MAIKLSTQAISSMPLHSVGAKIYPTFSLSLSLILLFFGLLSSQADAAGLAWSPGNDLPQAVELSKVVRSGNLVYVIGGRDSGSNATNAVYRARIGINGVVGNWESARSLPNPLYFHAAAIVNGHIFVIGGWDGSNWRREVWRATIQSDGNLGEWISTGLYPIEIALHDVIGIGSKIYVVGGQNNASGGLNEVRFAQVQTNGMLGSWTPTSTLPESRYRLSLSAANGYLYATGGYDGSNARNSIYVARINGDGTLQSWQLANFAPGGGRFYHSSHVINGRLTLVGGYDGNNELTSVCSAPLTDGFPSATWTCDDPSLPMPLQRFAAVTYPVLGKDALLVMGGRNGGTLQTKSYILTEPGMDLTLYNQPSGFVAPSQEITYTIRYQNRPFFDLSPVSIVATIPDGVKLVPDSQEAGNVSGNQITWNVGPLGKGTGNTLSYRVRRDHPADAISSSPSVTNVLGITKTGPLLAEVGKPFTYTLSVTTTILINHELIVMDTLPQGVQFVTATASGGGVSPLVSSTGVSVSVSLKQPNFAPGQQVIVALQVVPTQAGILENSSYGVLGGHDPAPVSDARTSGDVTYYSAAGRTPVRTVALLSGGDGSKIVHTPVQANWSYQSIDGSTSSNWVSNPHNNLNLLLPLIFR